MADVSRALLEHIGELIAIPSVSSVSPVWDISNQPLIDALANRLESAGWRIAITAVPGVAGKYNLVATLGQGAGGLVLAGHTDTVPCDPDPWSSDPWRLHERNDRLYGLGTADMKSFFAVAMAAASGFRKQDLHAPVTLVATADEESTMSGARALAAAGFAPARIVIGEPTGLRPVRLHKGILMESIRIRGQSGHSSDPSLGLNALEGMHVVINALLAWRAEFQARQSEPAFAVPHGTLNLGHIHGGDNPNRICGECELHIDLRFLPGDRADSLRQELRERVESSVAGQGFQVEMAPLFAGSDPLDTSPESLLVKAAEEISGFAAGAVAFATEGPFFAEQGADVVILGPGDIAQAHQPDEYLSLEQLTHAESVCAALIGRFCLG